MITDEKTIQKSYGWIFFFNSKDFLLTRNYSASVIGCGPLVVMSRSGRVIPLGSSLDPEKKIFQFEQRFKMIKRWLLIAAMIMILGVAAIAGLLIFWHII